MYSGEFGDSKMQWDVKLFFYINDSSASSLPKYQQCPWPRDLGHSKGSKQTKFAETLKATFRLPFQRSLGTCYVNHMRPSTINLDAESGLHSGFLACRVIGFWSVIIIYGLSSPTICTVGVEKVPGAKPVEPIWEMILTIWWIWLLWSSYYWEFSSLNQVIVVVVWVRTGYFP